MMDCSDTPQGCSSVGGMLTPRRVALAAALAWADALPGFFAPVWFALAEGGMGECWEVGCSACRHSCRNVWQ